MQWGTPEDLEEYNYWSSIFLALSEKKRIKSFIDGLLVMPMAGMGKRFVDKGYKTLKPLIPVSGKPMFQQAIELLPEFAQTKVVILSRNQIDVQKSLNNLSSEKQYEVVKVAKETTGQASTAALATNQKQAISPKHSTNWLHVAACDSGCLFDETKYQNLILNENVDVIVWGMLAYPNAIRNPKMYGWINADGEDIQSVVVKKEPQSTKESAVVIGTFAFRNPEIYHRCLDAMQARNGRINGEFYIDEMINDALSLGLSCKQFLVDHYLCWGTPDDLKTFQYWQSCFHKWTSHPYSMNKDMMIDKNFLAVPIK